MEHSILLGETLDITTVAVRQDEWRQLLRTGPASIRMVTEELSRIDTAGLQLLVAFRNDAAKHGKTVIFSAKNEILLGQAKILGLTSALWDEHEMEHPAGQTDHYASN